MHLSKRMENACGTIGHVQSSIFTTKKIYKKYEWAIHCTVLFIDDEASAKDVGSANVLSSNASNVSDDGNANLHAASFGFTLL